MYFSYHYFTAVIWISICKYETTEGEGATGGKRATGRKGVTGGKEKTEGEGATEERFTIFEKSNLIFYRVATATWELNIHRGGGKRIKYSHGGGTI